MVLRRKVMEEPFPLATGATTKTIPSAKPRRLLTFSQTPAWYESNTFILTGYRPESRSIPLCFHSWTYLHNETCNIFSHLIPAVLSTLAQWTLYSHLSTNYPDIPPSDRCILAFHLLTATICLGVSAHYHTFMNHSPAVARSWLRVDYMGIMTLVLGDFISAIYFGFYCEEALRRGYWFMIIALGTLTAAMLTNPRFEGPEWRSFRLFSFIGTGLSGFAPIAHASLLFGVEGLWDIGVGYYLVEGVVLVLAAYIYERQIPERMYPGKFDIWGHSHTIFHVLVVVGTAVHMCGLLSAFEYVYHYRSC